MTDWDSLRRAVFRIIGQTTGRLTASAAGFADRIIARLRSRGWRLDEEAEGYISELANEAHAILTEALQNAIAGAAAGQGSDFIQRQLEEAFHRRLGDDLNLSDRLWRWQDQTRRGVLDSLAESLALRRSVNGVIFDMQRTIERESGARFDIVADRKPVWIKKLEQAGRRVIRNPQGKQAWDKAIQAASDYIDRLQDTGTRQQSLAMLKKIEKAVASGQESLIAEAIRWRIYDKQLYNLKRIARTEISTAWHRATIAATRDDALIIGYRWRLSASHPDPDICDWFAGIELGLGKGVWPKDRVPEGKAHPHCLCSLIPVTRPGRERGAANAGELMQRLPEAARRRIAPRWAVDLNNLGVDWQQMTDPGNGWFLRKQDIAARVGEEKLTAMQALGRSLGEGRWGQVRLKGARGRETLALLQRHQNDPVARAALSELERYGRADSRKMHYIRRRYLDGEPVRSPADLDREYERLLRGKAHEVRLQRHHDKKTSMASLRYVIHDPDSRWMAMTDASGRRITVHRLRQEAVIDDYGILQWQIEDLRF